MENRVISRDTIGNQDRKNISTYSETTLQPLVVWPSVIKSKEYSITHWISASCT